MVFSFPNKYTDEEQSLVLSFVVIIFFILRGATTSYPVEVPWGGNYPHTLEGKGRADKDGFSHSYGKG